MKIKNKILYENLIQKMSNRPQLESFAFLESQSSPPISPNGKKEALWTSIRIKICLGIVLVSAPLMIYLAAESSSCKFF